MLFAVTELAFVDFSAGPLENAESVRLAELVLSLELVAVFEDFEAVAVLFIVEPLSLVNSAPLVNHDAQSLATAVFFQLSVVIGVLVEFDLNVWQQREVLVGVAHVVGLVVTNCLDDESALGNS